jgi:prepilin-type N-terminal cleavage/methylation domain-containing protein
VYTRKSGFTVIELIVAIAIIGILTALAFVSYADITNRVVVASLKHNLSNNDTKLKAYSSNYGSYPTTLGSNNCPSAPIIDNSYCLQSSSSQTITSYVANANSYVLKMQSNNIEYQVTPTTQPSVVEGSFALRLNDNVSDDFGNKIIQASDGGLVLAGTVDYANSTVCQTGGCNGTGIASIAKFTGRGNLTWARGWDNAMASPQTGISQEDEANDVKQLSDGSYIMTGSTHKSGVSNYDATLVKINSNGSHLWSTIWGGTAQDYGSSVISTSDVGFLVAGTTWSYQVGVSDAFIAKFDASGSLSWSKTVGTGGTDIGVSAVAVSDGYLLAGQASQTPFVAKLNFSGVLQWVASTQLYSGASNGQMSLISTTDGGFALTGTTTNFGTGGDAYIVKFTSGGTVSWTTTWGGTGLDQGNSIIQTIDGGYLIAGNTNSYGGGGNDAFIAKFNATGNLSWSRTWGGTSSDYGNSVFETIDAGYVLAGYTYNYDSKIQALVARYDSNGSINNCSAILCRTINASSSSQPTIFNSGTTLTSTSPSAASSTVASPSYLTLNPTITIIAQ